MNNGTPGFPQSQQKEQFLTNTEQITREGQSFLDFKRKADVANFPAEFSTYARSMGDVYFWPQGGFHVVTKAAIAKDVLTSKKFSADRSRFFISRMPNLDLAIIKDFFAVVGRMMVMSDAKIHSIRRGVANAGLNENLLEYFEPMIEKTVQELLRPLRANQEIDFATEIARELPQAVLADLFCIPKEDRAFFNKCSTIMTGFFGGAVEYTNEVGKEVNEAAIAIHGYFKKLLEERRQKPRRDFFTGMLAMQEEAGLDDDDLISQAVMMLVAGQVTTTDQICNNMFLMLKNRETYQALTENPALLSSTIEECKRLDPAVTFLFRVCTEDTLLGDQPVKTGDTVFIANHAINRDPDEFAQPEEMILDRKANRHFAYGHGPHYCMGARLGRMQMSILFGAITKEFPNLKLGDLSNPDEIERDHYSLSFSGFKKLRIALEAH